MNQPDVIIPEPPVSGRLYGWIIYPGSILYHCDRLGYMVWGEYPNCGLDYVDRLATEIFLNEWSESVERDFNHPAIIGWCPFNETWGYFEQKEQNSLIPENLGWIYRACPQRE